MNDQIKVAFEEYRKAVEAERSLSEEINKEGRKPTAEETEKFERMEADIAANKHELDRLVKVNARSKEVEEARASFSSLFEQADKSEREPAKRDIDHLISIRQQVLSGAGHVVVDEEDPANPFFLRQDVVEAMATRYKTGSHIRALGSTGGTAVDTTFVNRVHFYEVDESPMLDPAVVNVFVTNRGETMTLPRLTADANVAGTLTAEATTLTAADASISTISLSAYKYGGIQLWSAELDEDEVIGLQDILARSAARHIAEQANSPLTTGDGSNKPNGIVTAAANGGTAVGTAQTGGDNFFGWRDLVDLVASRKPGYRRRGQFLVSTTAFAKIRKFVDANGSPIFLPALTPGQPETLLGYPVRENPDMAAVGSASKSVIFGDTQLYYVRRVGGLRVEVSRDYKFDTDQLALKTVARLDGDLLDANAVAYLVSAAA